MWFNPRYSPVHAPKTSFLPPGSPERLVLSWAPRDNRRAREEWSARSAAVRYAALRGLMSTRADVTLRDTSWPELRRPVMRWRPVKSVWHFTTFPAFRGIYSRKLTFILRSILVVLYVEVTEKKKLNFVRIIYKQESKNWVLKYE